MTIGEFSNRCGLSPKVLRSYAEAGVLVPAVVDATSGYRHYEVDQLEQADTGSACAASFVTVASGGALSNVSRRRLAFLAPTPSP